MAAAPRTRIMVVSIGHLQAARSNGRIEVANGMAVAPLTQSRGRPTPGQEGVVWVPPRNRWRHADGTGVTTRCGDSDAPPRTWRFPARGPSSAGPFATILTRCRGSPPRRSTGLLVEPDAERGSRPWLNHLDTHRDQPGMGRIHRRTRANTRFGELPSAAGLCHRLSFTAWRAI